MAGSQHDDLVRLPLVHEDKHSKLRLDLHLKMREHDEMGVFKLIEMAESIPRDMEQEFRLWIQERRHFKQKHDQYLHLELTCGGVGMVVVDDDGMTALVTDHEHAEHHDDDCHDIVEHHFDEHHPHFDHEHDEHHDDDCHDNVEHLNDDYMHDYDDNDNGNDSDRHHGDDDGMGDEIAQDFCVDEHVDSIACLREQMNNHDVERVCLLMQNTEFATEIWQEVHAWFTVERAERFSRSDVSYLFDDILVHDEKKIRGAAQKNRKSGRTLGTFPREPG